QIFYQYFPSLLDINSVHFEVGVTPKVRTTETADAFIRSLVELQLKSNAGNASHQKQQQQFSQEQLSAGVEGIPYASPPVGRLRFMPPVTPPTWTTTRSATTFGPVCPQRLADISNETEALGRMTRGRLKLLRRLYPLLANQSEDCLYLNIYTVASATRELARLPVLMFIHGESYEWNAGSTVDGSVLASASGLVVVTINYRLGILGFFPSPGGSARGNFGLMDQVAALHWIQENIREFGGDERNVTVMGHGTGAACVNFLMLSPMARGLFHRAIMASGSALSPWAIASDAVLHGQTVARAVGCQSSAQ
ncbi:PREDICTED: neuroligin-4, X-linked-like, partial [Rhagoletis zephyria]|uniref:neuroligin-4, X-linked-like n=1 Tax=Rhagoletis zephyria TaxID=28612 RepID=UPI000811321E